MVGFDGYATRKGRYGTVLVNVETRRPVDMLPDREASSLAASSESPGIEPRRDVSPSTAAALGGLAPEPAESAVAAPPPEQMTGSPRPAGHRFADRIRDRHAIVHTLAAVIEHDLDAVAAGLTLPWSSGVVEGHVDRIKMPKRKMFGRAGVDLLRKRVLLYS